MVVRKVPTAVYVGFVVNTVAMGQVFLRIIRLSTLNYHSAKSPFTYLSAGAGTAGPLAAALRIK